jgi:5-hydroxyisourate hydrolase-like protein (transthyretin family)
MHNHGMALGRLPALVLVLVSALLVTSLPAQAADPVPTTLTLDSPRAFADQEVPVSVDLVTGDGTPVAGGSVRVERRVDGTWAEVALLLTDADGHAEVPQTLARDRSDNAFRAHYAGDTTYAAAGSGRYDAPMERRNGVVTVGGPEKVVDEQSVELRVRWLTGHGQPVSGRVLLQRRMPGEDWKRYRRPRTDADGVAVLELEPRTDTRWRVKAPRLDWVKADRSRVHRIDNLPPGTPVRLPDAAPRPRINLPDQPHARGDGANPRVSTIPTSMWNQMTGRSWHRGCPVGRSGLRLLRINYWAYDGYRHRGEVVARTDAIDNIRGALTAMYRRQLPLRSLYRVDRFGWSDRLGGADDYRSMASGNSSAFNCRDVVGRPGVRSPHSYGRSFDVNTWENPYHSSHGWTPNGWWPSRSHPRVAWRSREHVVVRIMLNHGFRWTYGTEDAHHFDVPAPSGRVLRVQPGVCDDEVCH